MNANTEHDVTTVSAVTVSARIAPDGGSATDIDATDRTAALGSRRTDPRLAR